MSSSSKHNIDERRAFIGLDEAHCNNLRGLKAVIDRELPKGLDRFYVKVKQTPELRKLFASDGHMQHAKGMQMKHWGHIAAADFGDTYAEKVRAIGSVHARIGLEPKWYIGGYTLLLENLIGAIIREYWPSGGLFSRPEKKADEVASIIASVLKAVMLDMDMSISVYGEEAAEARAALQRKSEAETGAILASLGNALHHVAAKDLTYRIEEDLPEAYRALKTNFNSALEQLSETIREIRVSATEIHSGSEEIRSAADDMAKRAEQQAAAVEETAAAVGEITAAVKQTTDRAEGAGRKIGSTKQNAESSGAVVRKAVDAMARIEKSSTQIANIIGVIDEIAFQTNLLALNAGVEAARAGSAGKGFAVVAQEVRELAQRSATAAKEIGQLITSSGEEVKKGVSLVNETGAPLERIVADVHEINADIQVIVEAAREQSTGLQEINTAIGSVDQAIQQNAAMVEQSTAASHALNQEVARINDMLERFEVGGEAANATPAQVPLPAALPPARNASPAHALNRKLVAAFAAGGNAAVRQDSWEEF